MSSPLVRNSDPVESHDAARAVMGTIDIDRLVVLKAFENLGKATYREAARHALRTDNNPPIERVESLRRRGSDLKSMGWIEQSGKHQGQAEFRITPDGKKAMSTLATKI